MQEQEYDLIDRGEVLRRLDMPSDEFDSLIEMQCFPGPLPIVGRGRKWLVKDVHSFLHLLARGVMPRALREKQANSQSRPQVMYSGPIPVGLESLAGKLLAECYRPAIYFLTKDNAVVYVGQSVRPMVRIQEHACGTNGTPPKAFDGAVMFPVKETALDSEEKRFIGMLNPCMNTTHRTDLKCRN